MAFLQGISLQRLCALARRLAHDARGNTLAIVAAAIIPLAALVGSGIDMSRAYMAQARLQMACDAAALAGRRAMTDGTVDATVRSEALKFFRFNFPTGENSTTPPFGVTSFAPNVVGGDNNAVVISASTTLPTTIMSMFGYTSIPIKADCSARLDFRNTDIMLVLDTTGSMDWDAAGNNVNGGSTSRIAALRSAVLALYDTLAPIQTQLEAVGLRIRYGIVPYSSGVNVGTALRTLNQDYLVSSWTYQSRVANFNTQNTTTTTSYDYSDTVETYPSAISRSNCRDYGDNKSFGSFSPSPTTGPNGERYTYARGTWGGVAVDSASGSGSKTCTRVKTTRTTTTTTTWDGTYKFTNWTYQPVTYNVANFRSGSTITLATNTLTNMQSRTVPVAGTYTLAQLATMGFSTSSHSFSGCVEERDTVSTITGTSTVSRPAGAHDLDMDTAPTSDATRWRPQFSGIVHRRNNDSSPNPTANVTTTSNYSSSSSCPTAARVLQTWTRTALSTYLNSLDPAGNTYHDFGMIWGARMVSPTGIFSATNPTTYGGYGVDRYLVFMTDGELNTNSTNYGLYGIEYLDRRVTGGYTDYDDQNARHAKRFEIACQEAKSKVNSVWVIVFTASMSTELSNCASSPSQAATVTTSAALISKFEEIGRNIGALRLTQ